MSEIVSETLREVTTSLDDGQYRIVSTLKEGRLYLAEKAGKRFVLKTDKGAKGLELLKREYEVSIGLSHPGLAYVFTYEEDSPAGPCLVQEFVDGETLAQWLSGNPSASERRRIFAELLSVVAYLHQKDIVHNDLKPENILISKASDTLKLIDLGFADSDTYLEKAIGGTRSYASPELLEGSAVTAASDVYSLGVVLRSFFPGRYRRIVRRCLQMDPMRRYSSAGELEKAWKNNGKGLRYGLAAVVAAIVLGGFLWTGQQLRMARAVRSELETRGQVVDSLQGVLNAIEEEKVQQELALQKAKDFVDEWYVRESRTYRAALKKAGSQQDVTAAWDVLLEKYNILYSEAYAMAPTPLKSVIFEYLLARYNDSFMPLSDEFTKRANELSGQTQN